MIKDIIKTKQDNKLTVQVECHTRQFAIHPIKVLTTKELIDKLGKEYKIKSVLSAPKRPVGNTTRRKMSTSGTWVFELESQEATKAESREIQVEEPEITEEKPKSKPRTKKTTSTTPSSIRNRMSKLANKEN